MSRLPESVAFYTPLQRKLHWLVILLVLFQYVMQQPMKAAMAAVQREETLSLLQFAVTTLHTWGGASIAAIMLWRWQLRKRAVPVAAGSLSAGRAKLVILHHVILYASLMLMALSGALYYYGGVAMAADWHEWGKWLLLGLIGLHIAGALTHVGGRDRVFQRMMGRNSLR